MKITKSLILLAFVLGIMTLGNQSCKKDSTEISLATKTEYVANVWKVDNYKLNGVDLTSLVSDYSETFTTDMNYSYQWGILGGTGSWMFKNNNEEIQVTGIKNVASKTLFIQKLEETQFWYYYMDGNDKKEFHLIPQ